MYATEGDLSNPTSALAQEAWFGFDTVIISMALHHVPDPIEMLSNLRKRLRQDGTLLVVEFFPPGSESKDVGVDGHLDKANMVEVVGGQRIWPDFTPQSLEGMLAVADFKNVDVKVLDETVRFPDRIGGGMAGTEKKVMFVKATAC